jgi:hypothetical protein
MKIFDYFYEEILVPSLESMNGVVFPLIELMLNGFLTAVLWVTVPIWIIPYLIIKHRKGKSHEIH